MSNEKKHVNIIYKMSTSMDAPFASSDIGIYHRRQIIIGVEYDEEQHKSFAIFPDSMIEGLLATEGFCELELSEDGKEVVSFTALEIPDFMKESSEPTAQDDTDAMLIDHEYRLTLLELGLTE
jgi:hypothetical protein